MTAVGKCWPAFNPADLHPFPRAFSAHVALPAVLRGLGGSGGGLDHQAPRKEGRMKRGREGGKEGSCPEAQGCGVTCRFDSAHRNWFLNTHNRCPTSACGFCL